jgi:N-acetylmuramoyl-L-alanine amidase
MIYAPYDSRKRLNWPLIRRIVASWTALALCATAPAFAGGSISVTDARAWKHPSFTRLVLDVSAPVEFEIFTLAEPRRLVIDFPELSFALSPQPLGNQGVGSIEDIRFGLFEPGKSRMVVDLDGPVRVAKAFLIEPMEGYSDRFVLDLEPTDAATFAEQARMHLPLASTPAPTGPPVGQNVPARADGKRVIVVDAGHGGVDPGAVASTGKYEKQIALEATLEIADLLNSTGRYHVVLTRDRDIFLPLRKRVQIARDSGAELFLSVHADSMKDTSVRGTHVYSLSKKASDAEAEALAAKENKSDVIAGLNLADYSIDVNTILLDLTQRETNNTSAEVANRFVASFSDRGIRSLNRPHRQAGFAVLKAPDVPSVLIELGFLSNKRDAAMLATTQGREPIVEAIVLATDRFFATRTAQNQ